MIKVFTIKCLSIVILTFLFFLNFVQKANATQIYDLVNSGNWNIRIDGAEAYDVLGLYAVKMADLDQNGYQDLVVGAYSDGDYTRTRKGKVYVIYDSILRELSGTGETLDLNDPQNYNVRFDGATVGDWFGIALDIGLVDNNKYPDLLIGASHEDYNHTDSGSVYLINNEILSSYTGIGRTVDMSDSNNYTLRFDGHAASDLLSYYGYSIRLADIDNNGVNDIFLGDYNSDPLGRNQAGILYIVKDNIWSNYSSKNVDLSDTNNYSYAIIGSTAKDSVGEDYSIGDIDGNGETDILINAPGTNLFTGSVYVFYDSLLASFSDKTIDLTTSTNYNYRIDSTVTRQLFGFHSMPEAILDINVDGIGDLVAGTSYSSSATSYHYYILYGQAFSLKTVGNSLQIGENTSTFDFKIDTRSETQGNIFVFEDFDSDGASEIFTGSILDDYNGNDEVGSFYSIDNQTFSTLPSGSEIDSIDENIYGFRFYGPGPTATKAKLGEGNLSLPDINGDGQLDIITSAIRSDYNSRTASGSLYIIYNFPHTITFTSRGKDMITGTIDASNSTTSVAGVQYNYNSNDPASSGWKNCLGTTSFTCTLTSFPTGETNVVYVRAYDTNGSYTAQSSYAVADFNDTTERASSCPWNFKHCVYAGPNRHGDGRNFINATNASIFISDTSHHDDLFIQIKEQLNSNLTIPLPQFSNLNSVGEIFKIDMLSAFNGYPVPVLDNPATIILNYDPIKVAKNSINPSSLRIAFYDPVTKRWKTIPKNTVVDSTKHTVANTTKVFNTYFAVVYETSGEVKNEEDLSSDNSLKLTSSATNIPTTPQKSKPKKCILWELICW